jgi:hypothetical protein
VRLKSLQRNPSQLAVEISPHVFDWAALATDNWGVHRISSLCLESDELKFVFLLVDANVK